MIVWYLMDSLNAAQRYDFVVVEFIALLQLQLRAYLLKLLFGGHCVQCALVSSPFLDFVGGVGGGGKSMTMLKFDQNSSFNHATLDLQPTILASSKTFIQTTLSPRII